MHRGSVQPRHPGVRAWRASKDAGRGCHPSRPALRAGLRMTENIKCFAALNPWMSGGKPGHRAPRFASVIGMNASVDAAHTIVTDASDAAGKAADETGRVTPMMEQYIEIKAANPDCLLFYRMGAFYELFFEDAEVATRALGIVLTKRGKHLGNDIPMCGVPVERADEYLHRLIALGHRVAVCEQLEDPAIARK